MSARSSAIYCTGQPATTEGSLIEMGFINPSPSPVEPSEFVTLPLRERIRILSTDWADHGFGAPGCFTSSTS